MKTFLDQLPILAVLGWSLVAGCVSSATHELVLDPVGPAPGGQEIGRTGMLVVYSNYNHQTNVDRFFGAVPPVSADYDIFTKYGKPVQEVRNDAGEMEGPVMVRLPVGDYHVKALAVGYGIVRVPVIIKANQVTVVRLDECSWPERDQMIRTGAVRLPDGRVVGWSATSEPHH